MITARQEAAGVIGASRPRAGPRLSRANKDSFQFIETLCSATLGLSFSQPERCASGGREALRRCLEFGDHRFMNAAIKYPPPSPREGGWTLSGAALGAGGKWGKEWVGRSDALPGGGAWVRGKDGHGLVRQVVPSVPPFPKIENEGSPKPVWLSG